MDQAGLKDSHWLAELMRQLIRAMWRNPQSGHSRIQSIQVRLVFSQNWKRKSRRIISFYCFSQNFIIIGQQVVSKFTSERFVSNWRDEIWSTLWTVDDLSPKLQLYSPVSIFCWLLAFYTPPPKSFVSWSIESIIETGVKLKPNIGNGIRLENISRIINSLSDSEILVCLAGFCISSRSTFKAATVQNIFLLTLIDESNVDGDCLQT